MRRLVLLVLLCGCSTPAPEKTYDNPYRIIEGVVDSVKQIEHRQIELTLDGETRQYECGLPAEGFYIEEYHTFLVIGDRIETVYFGESSGDLSDLEMLYDD